MSRLILFFVVVLAGCTSVVYDTVRKVNQIDPLAMDPADYKIDLRIPDGVRLISPPKLVAKVQSPAGSHEEEFLLDARPVADDVTRYGVAASDLETIRALQIHADEIRKQYPGQSRGSFSIHTDFCKDVKTYDPEGKFSISLILEQGGDPMPLLRPMAIKNALKVTQRKLGRQTPNCPSAS